MKDARKVRLDLLLIEQEMADSQQHAQRLIMAGQVTVDGRMVDKPGTRVPTSAEIKVAVPLPYVSRGGFKLAAALDAVELPVSGWVVADVGASTGGFTDCLLQRDAARVYAIDVGYGQLAWKLRQDSRVTVMDRSNARHLAELPEPVDLATIDVSFISLRLILPAVRGWLHPEGQIVALIKPQFEAERDQVGKGGVIHDPAVHRAVLDNILTWAESQDWGLQGLVRSPITGPAGNIEFLAHWKPGQATAVELEKLVKACLDTGKG